MDKDVSQFLQDSFRSVWSLELLVLLHGQPDRVWTDDQLIAELRSSEVVIQQGISDLLAAGLIVTVADNQVQYSPVSRDLDAIVPRVAEAYRVEPSKVRRLIVQRPSEKLRNFSEAFRIVKKD
jgi:hypothetical protein